MTQSKIYVGNAPCSWGTLEFEGMAGERLGYEQMLNELAATGYTGTELGDWGFMPAESAALLTELTKRHLVMTGAFVPVALKNSQAHAPGEATAVRTARLLAFVRGWGRFVTKRTGIRWAAEIWYISLDFNWRRLYSGHGV